MWKILNSVKILKILDLSLKNLDFAQTFQIIEFCEKLLYIISILSKFSKIFILVKIHKFLISVKIFKNVQNFRKILISVKILWKSWHWSKFSKNLDFSQDLQRYRFLSKISEVMSKFVKIFGDPEFCQNFR